jgi:hypothetical protein
MFLKAAEKQAFALPLYLILECTGFLVIYFVLQLGKVFCAGQIAAGENHSFAVKADGTSGRGETIQTARSVSVRLHATMTFDADNRLKNFNGHGRRSIRLLTLFRQR